MAGEPPAPLPGGSGAGRHKKAERRWRTKGLRDDFTEKQKLRKQKAEMDKTDAGT